LWQFSALPIRKNSRVSRNSRSLQRLSVMCIFILLRKS
jgi:hypothetical protein